MRRVCVCVQIHIFVTLEGVIHSGRSHQFVLFCTRLLTHSKAAFCVNISVVAASDKQRNVGVVCIFLSFYSCLRCLGVFQFAVCVQ